VVAVLGPSIAGAEAPAPALGPSGGAAGGTRAHEVQTGETLWSIAAANEASVETLVALNPGLADPNRIRARERILVPARGDGATAEATEEPTCEALVAGDFDAALRAPSSNPAPRGGAPDGRGDAGAGAAPAAAAPSRAGDDARGNENRQGEDEPPAAEPPLAYGRRVTATFRAEVRGVAARLGMSADHLMAIMHYETGGSFRPSIRNPYTGATGLIQFLPSTADRLGTSVAELAAMTAEEQLVWVERYFAPFRGRLGSLGDAYMAVLYPAAVGQPGEFVLFRVGSQCYETNPGLDRDGDGAVTRGEVATALDGVLERGLAAAAPRP
jgi:LysM repeat protein